ncbi:hypothetical protein EDC02_7700 [Micromonospora sp. Llam0]|uniref:hypothetical protein n=1 Tax=Micromonospora sp. Llam0 TaxID=2485143 RepID=UPI000F4994A3|nr:hypothetical protein [Micromonospora sp. Llam0]ROO52759.1 hypothetical protein EDC02_7700 [Micromonospora sp. Llam0]
MSNTTQQRALTLGRPTAQLAITAYPHPQPLAALAGAPGQAVIVLHADRRDNAVVLAQPAEAGTVHVLIDGQARSVSADIPAVPVTDSSTALALARQAVEWALAARHSAVDRARGLAERLDEQRQRHVGQVAEIRAYAIDRHRDGDICRDGLDKFLDHFGLDPYEPRHRVQFTISGSFAVTPENGRDTDGTGYDVREYLRLDTDQVDGVDEDSVTFDVMIDEVETGGE